MTQPAYAKGLTNTANRFLKLASPELYRRLELGETCRPKPPHAGVLLWRSTIATANSPEGQVAMTFNT